MVLGMSVGAFTTLHVVISLAAILSGIAVLLAMIADRRADAATVFFLWTTVATSVTGFFFHSRTIGPPHILGVISLVVLALALFAFYGRGLRGRWRPAYVVSAVIALYLNCLVGVAQAFQKLPPLHALAPNGSEPPVIAAQAAMLALFLVLGALAMRRYHPTTA